MVTPPRVSLLLCILGCLTVRCHFFQPPTTLHKHSLLSSATTPRAIATPHPGLSYNPTLDDHQALLAAEHEKLLRMEEEQEKLNEAKEKVMKGQAGREDAWETGYADEVGSGEEDDDDDEDAIQSEDGDHLGETRKQRKQRRKTEKQKRKRQANKLMEVGDGVCLCSSDRRAAGRESRAR